MAYGFKVRTQPYKPSSAATTSNHTPLHTTVHHRTPPYTTVHHRTPPTSHIHIGYHWLHAVATMFKILVVVVIHRHDVTYCFVNPSHDRIHLYKIDAVTHFDALHKFASKAMFLTLQSSITLLRWTKFLCWVLCPIEIQRLIDACVQCRSK